MQSALWGPPTWEYLHIITFNYPEKPTEKDKNLYLNFFDLATKLLPCSICVDSFTLFNKYIPLKYYLDDRYSIVYWLFYMHNLVNLKLNHPQFKFINLILKYENYRLSFKNKKIELTDSLINLHDNTILKHQDTIYKRTMNMIRKNPLNPHIIAIKTNIKEP